MLETTIQRLLEPSSGQVEILRLHVRSAFATKLIEGVITPAVIEGAICDVDGFHVRRHWLHGPHLQLGWVGPKNETPPKVDELCTKLQSALGGMLRAASDEYPTREIWQQISTRLGEAELVNGPYLPLHPEGSLIRRRDPRLRADHIGSAEVQRFRARALSVLGAALAPIRPSVDSGDATRLEHCLGVLIVMASSYATDGLENGYLSLVSHAHDFLHDHDRGERLQASAEPMIQRLSEHVDDLVRSLLGGVLDPPFAPAEWIAFAQSCRAVTEAGIELAERGEIHPYLPPAYIDRARDLGEGSERKWRAGSDRTYSTFHGTLRQLDFTDQTEGSRFAAYRHLTAFGYELLSLSGISPRERVICSLAVGRAVERITGTDWREIFAKGTA